jgi:hypothetical protein
VPLAATAQDMKGVIENHSQVDDPESSIRLGEWKQGPKDSSSRLLVVLVVPLILSTLSHLLRPHEGCF